MVDTKKPPILVEKKTIEKKKKLELQDKVQYFTMGHEPRTGIIINSTEYKGEKLYEVDLGGGVTKWGSDRQLFKVT